MDNKTQTQGWGAPSPWGLAHCGGSTAVGTDSPGLQESLGAGWRAHCLGPVLPLLQGLAGLLWLLSERATRPSVGRMRVSVGLEVTSTGPALSGRREEVRSSSSPLLLQSKVPEATSP